MMEPLNPTDYRTWIRTTLTDPSLWEEHCIGQGPRLKRSGVINVFGQELVIPDALASSLCLDVRTLRITVGGVHVGTVFEVAGAGGTRFFRHLVPMAQFPRGTVKTQV